MDSTRLIIHNVGYIFSIIEAIFVIVFLYKKINSQPAIRLLILSVFATLIFLVSHVIGVNVHNPDLSQFILMFNLSIIYIGVFFLHTTLTFIGKIEEKRKAMNAIYFLAIFMTIFFIIFPETYLLQSVPKLYFPNYYVAGSLDWLARLIFSALVPAYLLYQVIAVYRVSDNIMKNRIRYYFVAVGAGFTIGATAIPLVFDITIVDPIWSIFFATTFFVPLMYSIVKYELLDIVVVAKQALFYAFYVVVGGISIGILFFLNNLAEKNIKDFPIWVFPIVLSAIIVTIGIYIWNKLRETDQLKYDFISIVTHKFRTPLTYIKWASDSLLLEVPEANKEDIRKIQESNYKLTELINILSNLSETESGSFNYKTKSFDLYEFFEKQVVEYQQKANYKRINIEFIGEKGSTIYGDEERISSAIEILIDNSISYTPENGKITIKLGRIKSQVILQIIDNGIGLDKEEKSHLFTKFYRSSRAQRIDTEGMGIGLFMVKRIIEKHGGSINASSKGENLGTVFTIVFPHKK